MDSRGLPCTPASRAAGVVVGEERNRQYGPARERNRPPRFAEVLCVTLAFSRTQEVIPVRTEVEAAPPDELPEVLLLPFLPCQRAELVQLPLEFQALLG